jgi:hypothetical protein
MVYGGLAFKELDLFLLGDLVDESLDGTSEVILK